MHDLIARKMADSVVYVIIVVHPVYHRSRRTTAPPARAGGPVLRKSTPPQLQPPGSSQVPQERQACLSEIKFFVQLLHLRPKAEGARKREWVRALREMQGTERAC